ncbi:MAG: alcohol dehydrogenase, partial [Acidobacteriota bacterium]
MLAAHIASGAISLIETPRPRLRKGFSLLRLRLAGICNTDIELLRGYYGFAGIPGHEFVADV